MVVDSRFPGSDVLLEPDGAAAPAHGVDLVDDEQRVVAIE